jgi:hypothetical protein
LRTISGKPIGVGEASQPWTPALQTIFVADAHLGDGHRFIVGADEKLTALVELELVIRAASFKKARTLPI